MSAVKGTLLGILSLALMAGIVLGGWQAGWWFKTQNTNRNAHLYQHQYGRQVTLKTDISQKLGAINDIAVQLADPAVTKTQNVALDAQRLALARTVCQDADLVDPSTPLPADQQSFVQINCQNGDVSSTSPLRP